MVESALRGVVREAIASAVADGLPGGHHFYITFKTDAAGVEIGDYLRDKYPNEMTIVIEHQFWDLTVSEKTFAVTLSFNNRPERLTVPFTAITAFADPSVKFGLQFQETTPSEAPAGAAGEPHPAPAEPQLPAQVPRSAKERASPRLVEDKPAADAKKSGAGKSIAKKPGEVVTLDTFRKK